MSPIPTAGAPAKTIEFWFEFGSNYSYLSVMRIEDEAARRGVDRATVGWLRAIVTERDGRLDEAERLLAAAHIDDPEMPHVIDRLAWYASDRGDARRASMMWRLLDADDVVAADARVVDAASDDPGRSLGRNDRCWCGSGRKFKQCHGKA